MVWTLTVILVKDLLGVVAWMWWCVVVWRAWCWGGEVAILNIPAASCWCHIPPQHHHHSSSSSATLAQLLTTTTLALVITTTHTHL